ncbi:unnamed protein product [Chrysoparadoxa australica]
MPTAATTTGSEMQYKELAEQLQGELEAVRQQHQHQHQQTSSSLATHGSGKNMDKVALLEGKLLQVSSELGIAQARLQLQMQSATPALSRMSPKPGEDLVYQKELLEVKDALARSEERGRELGKENLRLLAEQAQLNTPSSAKILGLSGQLASIEQRMSRRQVELEALLREVTRESKMEMARTNAIHAAEMASKDDLIVQFKNKLEQLLLKVQQLHNTARKRERSPLSS